MHCIDPLIPHAFSHVSSSCQAATAFERPHQDLFYYPISPQSGPLARTPSHSMEAILNEFAVQPWVRSRQFLHFLKIQSSTLSIVYMPGRCKEVEELAHSEKVVLPHPQPLKDVEELAHSEKVVLPHPQPLKDVEELAHSQKVVLPRPHPLKEVEELAHSQKVVLPHPQPLKEVEELAHSEKVVLPHPQPLKEDE